MSGEVCAYRDAAGKEASMVGAQLCAPYEPGRSEEIALVVCHGSFDL